MQENVEQTIQNMTGVAVCTYNITVAGLTEPPSRRKIPEAGMSSKKLWKRN